MQSGTRIKNDSFSRSLRKHTKPVLKSLLKSGVNIVAIHHPMTGEQPRILFLHYWGRGKSDDLANAVKIARGEQSKAGATAARRVGGFQEIVQRIFKNTVSKARPSSMCARPKNSLAGTFQAL